MEIMLKKLLLLILIGASLSSCANDDDINGSAELSGDWYLTSMQCYCAFDPSVKFEDFTMQFEENQNVVHFSNPTEDYYYISPSGSYNYVIDGDILKIRGAAPFKYEISGSRLILTLIDRPEIADDELVLYYEKM
jgi:hypothetical protein